MLAPAKFPRQLAINLPLDSDVSERLQLQIPVLASCRELVVQRPLDFSRPCIVTLDEVAVVAIHDPNQVGQAARGGSG
jgi:hypothetical protein